MPELALNLRRVAGRICHDDGMLVAADATVMDSLAWLRVMSAVPMGGNAELGAVPLLLPYGEPGGFQIPGSVAGVPAGGGADGTPRRLTILMKP